jgi:uncharacterized membrane protein YcaP (DUF421 family)
MAMFSIFRAAFGYVFLVFVLRIAGRRPGKQLSPFDYVVVFFLGGIMLTGIVGPEASLTNALCQIVTIALCHCSLAWLRSRYPVARRIIDGTPLVLMSNGRWRTEALSNMRLQDDDVMDSARGFGARDLESIRMAVLEPVGEITIIPREEKK